MTDSILKFENNVLWKNLVSGNLKDKNVKDCYQVLR